MEYEVVREIKNLCPNNQMRDVFIEEVQTEDPTAYVGALLQGKNVDLTTQKDENGTVTVYAVVDGLIQKFIFTPI